MGKTLQHLLRSVRAELQMEGPDGGGIPDWFIIDAINNAQADLAEVYPIRDTITFKTVAGENTYTLPDKIGEATLDNIIRVRYGTKDLTGINLDDYFGITDPATGTVNRWTLWGTAFIITGEVETDKDLTLYVTRAPTLLQEDDDIPEVPYYAVEAMVQYAISACHREQRDYDRANYHYGIYLRKKDSLLKRAVPQGQRDTAPKMRDTYWKPFRAGRGFVRTDTNPGGKYV